MLNANLNILPSKSLRLSSFVFITLLMTLLIVACGDDLHETPAKKVAVPTPSFVSSSPPPITTVPAVTTVSTNQASSSKIKPYKDTINLVKLVNLETTTLITITSKPSNKNQSVTDNLRLRQALAALNQPLLTVRLIDRETEINLEIAELSFSVKMGPPIILVYIPKLGVLQLQNVQPSDQVAVIAPVSFLQAVGFNSTVPAGLNPDLHDFGTTTNLHGSLSNEDARKSFLAAYKQGIPGRWESINFTIEGSPLSYQLYYAGNNPQIKLNLDNTKDGFASSEYQLVRQYNCQTLTEVNNHVELKNCSDGKLTIDLQIP